MVQFCFKTLPNEPFKLTELANVLHLGRHNSFKNLPIQFVNNMCSIGPYVGLKFKAIIPKSFWGAKLDDFLPEPFFSTLISLLAAFNHGMNGSVCLDDTILP